MNLEQRIKRLEEKTSKRRLNEYDSRSETNGIEDFRVNYTKKVGTIYRSLHQFRSLLDSRSTKIAEPYEALYSSHVYMNLEKTLKTKEKLISELESLLELKQMFQSLLVNTNKLIKELKDEEIESEF